MLTFAPWPTAAAEPVLTASRYRSAEKPDSVAFTGDLLGATELTASATEPTTVTCEARDGRPSAELSWFLGDRQLTDGVVPEEETNPDTQLVTSRSTLTHQFERQDEGATLRCQASHPAYGEQEQHEATLSVLVQCEYRPGRPWWCPGQTGSV